MKLYFTPGACSLSPHVALREAGLAFTLERVDLRAKRTESGGDYLAINPKGYVPALALDDGQVLTEGAVILQYIADQKPEAKLAPRPGTMERYRLQEWLNFIATELHKGMGPMYNPKSNDELKVAVRERVASRLRVLAKHLDDRPYIMGDFSVADPYAYYTLRIWMRNAPSDLTELPSLKRFFDRVGERPAVKAALAAETVG